MLAHWMWRTIRAIYGVELCSLPWRLLSWCERRVLCRGKNKSIDFFIWKRRLNCFSLGLDSLDMCSRLLWTRERRVWEMCVYCFSSGPCFSMVTYHSRLSAHFWIFLRTSISTSCKSRLMSGGLQPMTLQALILFHSFLLFHSWFGGRSWIPSCSQGQAALSNTGLSWSKRLTLSFQVHLDLCLQCRSWQCMYLFQVKTIWISSAEKEMRLLYFTCAVYFG